MIKKFLASILLTAVPFVLLAQTNPNVSHKIKPSNKSRIEARRQASEMAVGIQAAEEALTPAQLLIGKSVHRGRLPCELGAMVVLSEDEHVPGYFNVLLKTQKFRMFPVETSTGAVRLEDHHAGAVWLQLPNKSMLMSQKLGQRLADDCRSPEQQKVAEMMLAHPPQSILEAATQSSVH